MMLYIWFIFVQSFMKIFSTVLKLHNSVKNVDGVMAFVLCTSSDGGLYFYTVS